MESKHFNGKCPRGCGADYKPVPVDHIIKNIILKYKFSCKNCEDIFAYEKMPTHAVKCLQEPLYNCPLACGEVKIKGEDLMRQHLMQQCPQMQGLCTRCDTEILRHEQGKHKCKETTDEIIQKL